MLVPYDVDTLVIEPGAHSCAHNSVVAGGIDSASVSGAVISVHDAASIWGSKEIYPSFCLAATTNTTASRACMCVHLVVTVPVYILRMESALAHVHVLNVLLMFVSYSFT